MARENSEISYLWHTGTYSRLKGLWPLCYMLETKTIWTKITTYLVAKTGVWSISVLLYLTVKWSPSLDSLGQWSGFRIIPTDKWSLSCSGLSWSSSLWAKPETSKPANITKPVSRAEIISSTVNKGNTESFTLACNTELQMSSDRSRSAFESCRSKLEQSFAGWGCYSDLNKST